MHEIWRLSYDDITREVNRISQIDVGAETVRQFATHYFSENGHRIPVIGLISVYRSVKCLGIPCDAWVCGFPLLENILAPTIPHVWGYNNTSNQNWSVIQGIPYHNVSVAWCGTVPDRTDYMSSSPENVCDSAHRVCVDSLSSRSHERMRSPSTSRNPIRNPRVNHHGDDWEGPVDQ